MKNHGISEWDFLGHQELNNIQKEQLVFLELLDVLRKSNIKKMGIEIFFNNYMPYPHNYKFDECMDFLSVCDGDYYNLLSEDI